MSNTHALLHFIVLHNALCWTFWAETCSVMLTEYCYAIDIVLFDGNLINYSVIKTTGCPSFKNHVTFVKSNGPI